MIQVEELTKYYGERLVVSGLSFRLLPGELLVLVGGSGSGKTTTLKLINRLIEPTRGRVIIGSQDVSAFAPHELRRQIGYVSQRAGLFPHLTIAENIAVTPSLLGWSRERCEARVTELLDLVELPSSLSVRYPGELSGGQEQRVGVARALAAQPKLMLLDEPFGALDPLTRDRLQQSFIGLRRQVGLTAIFVTHDMTEALTLGDRVAVLRDGHLLQLGTPEQLLRTPCDGYVEQLLETPRRQARELERILEKALA